MKPLSLMKRPRHNRGVRDAVNTHQPAFEQSPSLRGAGKTGGNHMMDVQIVLDPLRP